MIRSRFALFSVFAWILGAALGLGKAVGNTLDLDGFPLIVSDTFPADNYVRQQARFWVQIYWKTGDDEGWLHDPLNPALVFRKIPAPSASTRAGRLAVEAEEKNLQADLRALFRSDSSQWTPEQRRLKTLLPDHWDSTAIELCAERLRFQRGLRDRFRQGLERSYRYLPLIDSVFAAQGVPSRLRYLPHVESSFHPHAYSQVGAAGMWQFMKATGRKFLKVGYYVDERRDPLASTQAAATMLLRNYALVKTWPLAIMAYNHGPGGVANAVATTGSTDMSTVLQSYYSNTFGFASRNFYAEFLAASTLAMLADSLFPGLDKWEPLPMQSITLSKSVSARSVAERAGLTLDELEEYNLALRPTIFRGKSLLPKGYTLRLPLSTDTARFASLVPSASTVPVYDSGRNVTPTDKSKTKLPTRVAAAKAAPAPNPPSGTGPRLQAATGTTKVTHTEPSLLPSPATQSEALASAQNPAPPATPSPPPPKPREAHEVVDSSFSLQISDWEKVAHPWDRFEPAVYNLGHRYEQGTLIVRVGPDETISHFSEWSGLPSASIRRDNHLRRVRDFRMNREIHLQLTPKAAETFVRRREEYFRGVEEDFYTRYHVGSLEALIVAKGTQVWALSQDRSIPFWLMLKHNPGRSLDNLHLGDTLQMPVIEEGWRHWGFTRYANTQEYFTGVRHYLASAGETGR